MSQFPDGQVPENSKVSLTCVTDEARPQADIIWTIADSVIQSSNQVLEPGQFNAYISRSVLSVTANRSLNNLPVVCSIDSSPSLNNAMFLDITCK